MEVRLTGWVFRVGGIQKRRGWGDERPEEENEEKEEEEESRDKIYALCSRQKNLCHESFFFLDAFSHLYERVCPSVCPYVRSSKSISEKKLQFSRDISNGGMFFSF